jgi:hypothetical protein
MNMKGGNTDELYQGDGRLKMAESLREQHPDVVKVVRKWGRWQHQVDYRPFKANKFILKPGFEVPTGVNNYGMEGGEPSIWDREASKKAGGADADAEIPARLLRQAFRHSGCCQACWDGGDLFCCDVCPAAYHGGDACAGTSITALRRAATWRCPQHSCMQCGRSASAAGGLIFRCQACPAAFCDEHLPEDVIQHGRIVDTCSRFAKLGWGGNKSAVFVHCSQECADFAAGGFDGWGDDTGEEDGTED